ncbi:MAG: HAD-IB family phosphatase [Verrucomicrobiales bacterium]
MTKPSIFISIDHQTLSLKRGDAIIQSWPISSARKGVGSQSGSNRTPVGNFQVSEKIGENLPLNTRFVGRNSTGEWDETTSDSDLILTRILWLQGLEPHNENTRDRYIYIHGTNHESQLGNPVSCGCIRMSRKDMADLFEQIETGIHVTIETPTQARENLIFFDCDSTLSTIEGIDELARARGPEIFSEVEALTHRAMNGEVPVEDVFSLRMELIQPDRALCETVAQKYIETQTEGSRDLIERFKDAGWKPIILSGGFAPLIHPLAEHLGIEDIEAVPLYFHSDGSYAGYGEDYPTTRNGGKPEIIRHWKQALQPRRVLMVGDGSSDLESRSECEAVIGYGGVVARDTVKNQADYWITSFNDFPNTLISPSLT